MVSPPYRNVNYESNDILPLTQSTFESFSPLRTPSPRISNPLDRSITTNTPIPTLLEYPQSVSVSTTSILSTRN